MKKSLIAKVVGLATSVVTLLLFLIGKVTLKATAVVAGETVMSEKESGKIFEIIENENGAFDDVKFRTTVVIGFILVLVATVYFIVSVVLDCLGKKLPVANLDLIGAIVLVVGVAVYAISQFVVYKDTETVMGITATGKMTLQTLACFSTYLMLAAGAGAVATQVVLKD